MGEFIMIFENGHWTKCFLSEISYFKALGNYTEVHFKNKPAKLISKNIGAVLEELNSKIMFLIHKSFAVNLEEIESYEICGVILLKDGGTLNVARSKKDEFKEKYFKGKI